GPGGGAEGDQLVGRRVDAVEDVPGRVERHAAVDGRQVRDGAQGAVEDRGQGGRGEGGGELDGDPRAVAVDRRQAVVEVGVGVQGRGEGVGRGPVGADTTGRDVRLGEEGQAAVGAPGGQRARGRAGGQARAGGDDVGRQVDLADGGPAGPL